MGPGWLLPGRIPGDTDGANDDVCSATRGDDRDRTARSRAAGAMSMTRSVPALFIAM
jgi:hypothetical protein